MKTTDKQPAAKAAKKPAPKKETRPVTEEYYYTILDQHNYLIREGKISADMMEKLADLKMKTPDFDSDDTVNFWVWADAVDQVMDDNLKDRESAPLAMATEVDNLTTGEVTVVEPDAVIMPLLPEQLAKAAAEVREHYAIAAKGIVSWAKLGLILITVRRTFPPRGGFVEWMLSEFPDISRRSMYNAMTAAEGLLRDALGIKAYISLGDVERINSIAERALGKSRRLLIAEAKEARDIYGEERAKAEVEKLFELYPDKREIWVPLVESGERTWADALKGITGAVASVNEDGTRRTREAYLPLFEKLISVPASLKHAGKWDAIPVDKQPNVIDAAAELMLFIPASCREVVLKKMAEKEAALNA